jgi:hypothetical protein
MKLCIHCKYCISSPALPDDPEYSRCGFNRPKSPVTGHLRTIPELPYCSTERYRSGSCTLQAINWERADHVMTEEEEKELMGGFPNV